MATGVDKQKPSGEEVETTQGVGDTQQTTVWVEGVGESMLATSGELQELMRQKGKERSRWGRRREKRRGLRDVVMG